MEINIKRLRLLRHQQEWTQGHVAAILNISIPAYSKIEAGITDVGLSILIQLSGIYKLSLLELFDFLIDEKKTSQKESQLKQVWGEEKLTLQEENLMLLKKIIELHEELRKVEK